MNKTKTITLFLVVLGGFFSVRGQTALNASGGTATGSGGTATYSYGQVAYSINLVSNASMAQGVQQPYEISVPTGFEKVAGLSLTCEAYPNPTTDHLILKIKNYDMERMVYGLYDAYGKLTAQKNIMGAETALAMAEYASGTYFLKVMTGSKEIKVFKINKH